MGRTSILGSPAHALFPGTTRNIVRNEDSRIRRELQPLHSHVDNDTQWKEEFDKRLERNASEVLSLHKKMDFIIDTLLSKRDHGNVGNESTHQRRETAGTSPTSRVKFETVGKEV